MAKWGAGLRHRQEADALGITESALYKRKQRERSDAEQRARAASVSPWIGARIWPPVEPDHPANSHAPRKPETTPCAT